MEHQLKQSDRGCTLNGIELQDVDYFGPRIGFIKFLVDIRWDDGKKIPGIVFCRGKSVAVLLVLTPEESTSSNPKEPYIVLVEQPRIPIASFGFMELPAGMMDDHDSFQSVASQELEEECGIVIETSEMIPLKNPGLLPSPGACDEEVGIYIVEKRMPLSEIHALQGKLGGLHHHGERIHIHVMPITEVPNTTQSMPVMAALLAFRLRQDDFLWKA